MYHNQPSASWRLWKASQYYHSESEVMRTRHGVVSELCCLKAEDGHLHSRRGEGGEQNQREGGRQGGKEEWRKGEFAPPPPFCSVLALEGLDDSHHIGEGGSSSFSEQIQTLISSRDILTDTFRNSFTSSQASLNPVNGTHKIYCHRLLHCYSHSPLIGSTPSICLYYFR